METGSPNAHFRVPRWYFFVLGIFVGGILGVNIASSFLVDLSMPEGAETAHFGRAGSSLRVFASFFAFLILVGIIIAAHFLYKGLHYLCKPRPRIQPQVLLLSFIAGVLSNIVIGGVTAGLLIAGGIEPLCDVGTAIHLGAQCVAALLGLCVALLVLLFLTSYTHEDPREIGLSSEKISRDVIWGVAGYCGAVPFVILSVAIAQYVNRIVFGKAVLPEHPIVSQLLEGRIAFVAAVVLAAIIAPLVEETFFRGFLHTALRGVMGFWGAAATSAAIFAAVHPTMPIGFLPLFVLGLVLAILRESTASLVPAVVCHCVNNTVALVLVRLVYGG